MDDWYSLIGNRFFYNGFMQNNPILNVNVFKRKCSLCQKAEY
ncbi:MAG: hypothetical protein ACI9T7_002102 [Oleiphilaceae bacterium]|jgi:hypothetical protein